MKVDKNVEPAVRKAYAAAVAGNSEWLNDALKEIADGGDDFAVRALELAVVVDAAALHALYDGHPDADQIDELLGHFRDSESWGGIHPAVARPFLTALADHTPAQDAVGLADLADVSIVMGAWLLSAFLPDGKDWTDFLDEILDALETSPTRP